jgi:uncharacterized cupredoxin-like copper-binding protein
MNRRLLASALLLVSAQALAQQPEPYITNAKEYVDKADWKNQEVVTVTFDEHSYSPQDLKLKAGKAYKIELRNVGEKDHYYTAPEFNRAVAWRKVMVNRQAEIKAPYFSAFEVLKKGGQLDLYLVPITKGTYTVICTIDDHRQQGMEGTITIE